MINRLNKFNFESFKPKDKEKFEFKKEGEKKALLVEEIFKFKKLTKEIEMLKMAKNKFQANKPIKLPSSN